MTTYQEFTELPAFTRAQWDGNKLLNDADPFKWGGNNPPPPVGAKVKLYLNDFQGGTVVGYFVEHRWLGVLVKISKPPKWWVRQTKARGADPKTTNGHFFGVDLEPRKVST
jgi:hypothetical protein